MVAFPSSGGLPSPQKRPPDSVRAVNALSLAGRGSYGDEVAR